LLWVGVDQQDARSPPSQGVGKVNGEGSFAYPALLVQESVNHYILIPSLSAYRKHKKTIFCVPVDPHRHDRDYLPPRVERLIMPAATEASAQAQEFRHFGLCHSTKNIFNVCSQAKTECVRR
jgi:hypothetical protein